MHRHDLRASLPVSALLAATAVAVAVPAGPGAAQEGADRATPQSVATALYEVISGGPDEPRDWERFHSLFLEGARIAAFRFDEEGASRGQVLSLAEFEERARALYRKDGFWEEEIENRVDRFGTLAHVWSTYATWIGSPGGEPVDRGINSIQMVRTGEGWAITSVAYYSEAAGEEIPDAYLPGGG